MGKILVTGGSGYIGSHSVLQLLEKGYEVVVYDNLSNSSKKSLDQVSEITGKKITFFKGDICEGGALFELFKSHSFDAVMHFAGLKSVGESCSEPIRYYENNVYGTLQLIKVMTKFNVKKLVFSSSATVYGDPLELPLKETTPTGLSTNPYGKSKLMIENILSDLFKSDPSWAIISLRYFNPLGAHKSGLIGEDPIGIPNNLMPIICQTATGKCKELTIYGNDYDTHDGTGIRDYIHVVDLAKGHINALEKVLDNKGEWTINLGTGKGYSVLDIVKVFEAASGKKIPFRYADRRPGDVASCYADVNYAEQALSWRAEKSLIEMCEDTWRWQCKNPNGYEN